MKTNQIQIARGLVMTHYTNSQGQREQRLRLVPLAGAPIRRRSGQGDSLAKFRDRRSAKPLIVRGR